MTVHLISQNNKKRINDVFWRLPLDSAATLRLCSTQLGLDKHYAAVIINNEIKTKIGNSHGLTLTIFMISKFLYILDFLIIRSIYLLERKTLKKNFTDFALFQILNSKFPRSHTHHFYDLKISKYSWWLLIFCSRMKNKHATKTVLLEMIRKAFRKNCVRKVLVNRSWATYKFVKFSVRKNYQSKLKVPNLLVIIKVLVIYWW